MDVWIHVISTSALVGGEWSVSRPCRFAPGVRDPGTHRIGGWMGPRAGLDDVEKWNFLTLRVQITKILNTLNGLRQIRSQGRHFKDSNPLFLQITSWYVAEQRTHGLVQNCGRNTNIWGEGWGKLGKSKCECSELFAELVITWDACAH
jgi:hypothetical protein